MKILKEILQVQDPEKTGDLKYSQSRVYLLITVVVMMGVLIYSLWLDSGQVEIIENATTTLLTMILIFGGYSLTGKGMSTYNKLKSDA